MSRVSAYTLSVKIQLITSEKKSDTQVNYPQHRN